MKKIILLLSILLCGGIGYIYANELGSGNGSSYPTTLDKDDDIETSTKTASWNVPNDSNKAIVKIEIQLSSNPANGYNNVRDRLDAFSYSTSTLKDLVSTTTDYYTFYVSSGIANSSMTFLAVGNILKTGTTFYITGMEAFAMGISTTGSSYFNIAYTSATGAINYYEYIKTSDVELTVNTNNSFWYVPDRYKIINMNSFLSLHIRGISEIGTLPTNYGIIIKYFYKN